MNMAHIVNLSPVHATHFADFLEREWDSVVQTLCPRSAEFAAALRQAASEMREASTIDAVDAAVNPVASILMDYPALWEQIEGIAAERRLDTGSSVLPDGADLAVLVNRFELLAQRAQEIAVPQQPAPPSDQLPAADSTPPDERS